MPEIPEITFSRILDEKPVALRPIYFAKNWEVYVARESFEFDGFRFSDGMIIEYAGSPVVTTYADQESFLTHLVECEMEIPIELKLGLSLDTRHIEAKLSKKDDLPKD